MSKDESTNDIVNCEITHEDVKTAFSQLRNHKSSADDELKNEYIKYASDKMLDIDVKIFNIIFHCGILPQKWLTGNIIPIYKNKGSQAEPKKYRPITIVSCFGQLFTAVLSAGLNKCSDEISLICENQAGYRKGYSTTDCVVVLYTLINLMKVTKNKLYSVFIDFEKAFDKVCRV